MAILLRLYPPLAFPLDRATIPRHRSSKPSVFPAIPLLFADNAMICFIADPAADVLGSSLSET